MEKYYKVVSWVSLFKQAYNIKEIDAIKPGTRFICKNPVYSYEDIMLISYPPVLHFSQGAFNTLLWYDVFEDLTSYLPIDYRPPTCIYEVYPITDVISGRSNDGYNLFQYGANIIEFGQRIPISQIAQNAVAEYEQNKIIKHIKYKRKMIKSFKSWQEFVKDDKLWAQYLDAESKQYC